MSVSMANVWSPIVIGRAKLDERRSCYLIAAPFDMDTSATGLMGTTISLDGEDCEVRGIVPNMPTGPISRGQLVELLVSRRGG